MVWQTISRIVEVRLERVCKKYILFSLQLVSEELYPNLLLMMKGAQLVRATIVITDSTLGARSNSYIDTKAHNHTLHDAVFATIMLDKERYDICTK